jgi:hypothetical protein
MAMRPSREGCSLAQLVRWLAREEAAMQAAARERQRAAAAQPKQAAPAQQPGEGGGLTHEWRSALPVLRVSVSKERCTAALPLCPQCARCCALCACHRAPGNAGQKEAQGSPSIDPSYCVCRLPPLESGTPQQQQQPGGVALGSLQRQDFMSIDIGGAKSPSPGKPGHPRVERSKVQHTQFLLLLNARHAFISPIIYHVQ